MSQLLLVYKTTLVARSRINRIYMTLKRWCKPKNPSSWIDFMHFSKLLPLKLTKFCYQKMAIVWSWMARHFQIILIVEKRPKRWKLFKTLSSEVFDYTKMNFFTMPITCRKGRRHFHICGIKRFDGVFFVFWAPLQNIM